MLYNSRIQNHFAILYATHVTRYSYYYKYLHEFVVVYVYFASCLTYRFMSLYKSKEKKYHTRNI